MRKNKVKSNVFFINNPDLQLMLKPDRNLDLKIMLKPGPGKINLDPQH
jgi:hypothetical protein